MFHDDYEVLNTDEAMEFLLVGKNTLYQLLQSGKIKAFRVGKKWRIPKKSILNYINEECYQNV